MKKIYLGKVIISCLIGIFPLPGFAESVEEKLTAQQKSDELWQKIVQTKYDALPKFQGVGFSDTLNLLSSDYVAKAFSHHGDQMIEGRPKLIHTLGIVARVEWISLKDFHPFTGLFASGAKYGFVRFSLAKPPSQTHCVPGMGLKLFVDNHQSRNLMAMYSLDEQEGHHIFANPLSNVLEEPAFSLTSYLLKRSFSKALKKLGDHHGSPLILRTNHMAEIAENGEMITAIKAPYRLLFVPTKQAQDLMTDKGLEEGFREQLAGKGNNAILYTILASSLEDGQESTVYPIGYLRTTSDFVASQYADEQLFFKHHL